MPPSQKKLSHGLCAMTLLLSLGGTLVACGTAQRLSSYGFNVASERVSEVDAAWFLVVDNATSRYGEVAMLNLAAKSIAFDVLLNEPSTKITPGVIHVAHYDCLADSELLGVFAALATDILGRDCSSAAVSASQVLRPSCYGYNGAMDRSLPAPASSTAEPTW
jgi:hypothetical protein